ncbi:MAG: class D sortase [Firmicutes bacterium]|nr:class D sortase [Bacillota bacterium]
MIKKLLSKKITKYIAVVLIFIGLYLVFRPSYIAWRFNKVQDNMLATWKSTSEFHKETEHATWHSSVAVVGEIVDDVWEEDTNPSIDLDYIINNMDGIISIEKINLYVPIINRYTINNLNISVCSVIEKNRMGQIGNYVIAGHRSRIRGRHFNRLIELKADDLIITENKEAKYTYKVTDVFLVSPDDIWVMKNDGNKKIITLITCDYRTTPTGRLIVRGELINTEAVNN